MLKTGNRSRGTERIHNWNALTIEIAQHEPWLSNHGQSVVLKTYFLLQKCWILSEWGIPRRWRFCEWALLNIGMDNAFLNWYTGLVCEILSVNVIGWGGETNICFLQSCHLTVCIKSCQKNQNKQVLQILEIVPSYWILLQNKMPL